LLLGGSLSGLATSAYNFERADDLYNAGVSSTYADAHLIENLELLRYNRTIAYVNLVFSIVDTFLAAKGFSKALQMRKAAKAEISAAMKVKTIDEVVDVSRGPVGQAAISRNILGNKGLKYVATGNKTKLGYDISKWKEYGLPSDGYFSKMIRKEDALDLIGGKNIDLAGHKGAGFISSAEELYGITSSKTVKQAMAVPYNPDYILEFQLNKTSGLQNLLKYNDELFRPGGKTLTGFKEFNIPGLNSNDIINWRLRKLIK
jgi:hypothetical protein